MNSSGYTVLGWIVWKIGTRMARREAVEHRSKLVAAGVVAAVLLGGVAAARTRSGDD